VFPRNSLRWFAGKPGSYQRPEQATMSDFPEPIGSAALAC
jgi:hypothetical protein